MRAIEANSLSKRFGSTTALDGLDLSVESGSFFGLLGPNGAGKSTFMSIVSGFLRQDSGQLSICERPADPNSAEQKKLIGLAPQHIALYKELSAEANLRLFGKLYGLSGKALRSKVDYALEIAQLEDRRKSAVKEFSGGMKRRLNIACSLLHDPKILLCDEPTVGVDPQSRNAIFETLIELKNAGTTILYSTHYMEEAERLCDTIAIIDHGKILLRGTLESLLNTLPIKHEIACLSQGLDTAQREEIQRFGQAELDGAEFILRPNEAFRLSKFYEWAETRNLDTRMFSVSRASLEGLFLHLTGRELRE